MPHIAIHTNVALDPDSAMNLAQEFSTLCAKALGKPEQYVQALVLPGVALAHGGTADPAAYVELKSIGLATDRAPQLSREICALLQSGLGLDPARVYIEFKDLDRALFGWNSRTF